MKAAVRVAITIGVLVVWSTVQAQDFTYTTTNSTITITGYTGLGGDVTIPGEINGLAVTAIRDSAFAGCTKLTNITIPKSVSIIKVGTFFNCTNLINVVIPDSITIIEGAAFAYCVNLTSIAIPDSVRSLGHMMWGPFSACRNLSNVKLGNGLTGIGADAFWNCTSLTNINIPQSVTWIADYAFSGCTNLTNVSFQGNAPAVDPNAFEGAINAIVHHLPGTTGWGSTFGGRPTALWERPNPTMLTTPSFGIQTNGFGFTVSWATNASVVVEAATSLSNPIWSPVVTNILTDGVFKFSDSKWRDQTSRFYRVRSL